LAVKSSDHLAKVVFRHRYLAAWCMLDKSELTDSAVVFQLEVIKTAATAMGKGREISMASFY